MAPRIAIVDDDQSIRKAVKRSLRTLDLDVEAYASAAEFLATLPEAVPDCLILDLHMPEMNGIELQQRLKQIGVSLPVVMITGHDEPGTQARCLAAGASRYLKKPLDEQALLEAIRLAMAK